MTSRNALPPPAVTTMFPLEKLAGRPFDVRTIVVELMKTSRPRGVRVYPMAFGPTGRKLGGICRGAKFERLVVSVRLLDGDKARVI